MALITVSDALGLLEEGLTPLGAEQVPLSQAHGRVLAEDLSARLTQPPFDASAMDGYAVRGADVAVLPASLEVIGESAAGAGFAGVLAPLQAVRIFTGAPVPAGADTVVIQEETEVAGNSLVVKEARQGAHIRPKGQDFVMDDVLLKSGKRISARDVMLAAAMNYADVPVRIAPRLAVLSTGDEIVPPGDSVGPDQIVASVSYGISSLARAQGADVIDLGIAKDDPAALSDAIGRCADADVLVTIGGASVGERDLVKSALTEAGLEFVFNKVAMRPGKPVFCGQMGATRVLGLPGNPVSAYICAVVFLLPLLRSLLGETHQAAPQAASLASALPQNGPREHFQRATSVFSDDGTRLVEVRASQDSSLMAALASADCLIRRPANAPGLPAGSKVEILPIPG
ncbi:MAG: gephyrin-like molybdotransferase Glp [Pseudomonadota bacterium]